MAATNRLRLPQTVLLPNQSRGSKVQVASCENVHPSLTCMTHSTAATTFVI